MNKTRSKFNVGKDDKDRIVDGIRFDSVLEARYYKDVVKPGVASGEIKSWERQKLFTLQPKFKYEGQTIRAIEYKADFVLTYADTRVEVIDIKGFAEPIANLKKKMFHYKYPEINYKWLGFLKCLGGWNSYEDIQIDRKTRKKVKKEKSELQGEN